MRVSGSGMLIPLNSVHELHLPKQSIFLQVFLQFSVTIVERYVGAKYYNELNSEIVFIFAVWG